MILKNGLLTKLEKIRKKQILKKVITFFGGRACFGWVCRSTTNQQFVSSTLSFQKRPNYLKNFKNPCWKDGNNLKCVAYFYLFGICKSGTSDFFKRLYLHPDIVPNIGTFGKELRYWSYLRYRPSKYYKNPS